MGFPWVWIWGLGNSGVVERMMIFVVDSPPCLVETLSLESIVHQTHLILGLGLIHFDIRVYWEIHLIQAYPDSG